MSTITRKYTDLDLSFSAHPITGDILKKKDDAAIIGSVWNLLQTSFYERLFQPQIGSNLRRLLFEPVDELTSISIVDDIKLTIKNFEPRVDLVAINATPDYDNQGYNVSLTFFIINDQEPITINILLERIR